MSTFRHVVLLCLISWVYLATGLENGQSPEREGEEEEEPKHLETSCHTCKCSSEVTDLGSTEFRVICDGDGKQAISMIASLFDGKPKPDNQNSRVYVRISNFSEVIVSETFLAKWREYQSCSMDLWYDSRIIFPVKCPPMANIGIDNHLFAGIGISHSSLSHLPDGIFQNKQEGQLTIGSSEILEINIGNLLLSNSFLGNFKISNSSVGTFWGSRDCAVSGLSEKAIEILDTRIGYFKIGAINFKLGKFGAKPKITLWNNVIGLLERESISLKFGGSINIENCTFGSVSPQTFVLNNGSIMTATTNTFGVLHNSLTNIICGESNHIFSDNILFRITNLNCMSETKDSKSCLRESSIDTYIHPSCSGYVLARIFPLQQNDSYENSFVIVSTLSTVLLIVVVVLVAIIIWRSIFARKPIDNTNDVVQVPLDDYFTPIPTAPIHVKDAFYHDEPRSRRTSHIISYGEPRSRRSSQIVSYEEPRSRRTSQIVSYEEPRSRRTSQPFLYGEPAKLVMYPEELFDM